MLHCGIDGLSQGYLHKGIMTGVLPISFVPLHLSAIDRSPKLLPWVEIWEPLEIKALSPEGWFEKGEALFTWLWTPHPSAAYVFLDILCVLFHKFTAGFHIILIPRLYTLL